jgi:hypothetical protein
MVPSKEDEKPEIEAFKKILEPSFDILPKQEKPTSIADKLLKAINQKEKEDELNTSELIKKEDPFIKMEQQAFASASSASLSSFKAKSAQQQQSVITGPNKKPLLVSSEVSLKHDDARTKGNVELQGTIQKLESAIATPISSQLDASNSQYSSSSTAINAAIKSVKQNDDSDTDSDRLVIEDETPSDVIASDKKKGQMGVLESIMMQDDVPYKHSSSAASSNNPSTKDCEKKSESGEQSETMSLLLCEETIPGSPAPASVKDPLSEIGRSPTSSTSGFIHPPPQSSTIKYSGSMTATLLHSQYQSSSVSHSSNVKNIPIDMEGIEVATGNILRDKLKSGSATSSGNNTNNNSDNSNDDQSESEKNSKIFNY